MQRRIFACAMTVLLLAITSWADDKEKEEDRLKNAGTVLTEILNIPDDIPQDLLDKADCVIVFPSVLKAAFVVGGSYGRRTMTRRTGENFNRPWAAPSMMVCDRDRVSSASRSEIVPLHPRSPQKHSITEHAKDHRAKESQ